LHKHVYLLIVLAMCISWSNNYLYFSNIRIVMDLNVKQKFEAYPDNIAILLGNIRDLIFSVAEQDGISELTETLKWGQPSYISNIGSTIRFDWDSKYPEQYCVYFNCNSSLVETFKEVFADIFTYQDNRAIVFKTDQKVPVIQLAQCISMSLRYKKIKHLDLLGS
ncbi:MAG: DUF1801 domain-containing protein, partial [Psychromonas sp.]